MERSESPFSPNILLAPLDWGLGHATRCIPIIRELLRQQAKVVLAGSGAVKILLHKEFPQLPFVDLKGYEISYSRNKWSLPFTMASQIPKIISVIQYENEQLKSIVKAHDIHAIISDNRYGLYHHHLPCVFMTHQLRIKTGLGAMADDYLQSLNYRYINRFTHCWIPDAQEAPSLAGELSHPGRLPSNIVRYLGPLSRLTAAPQATGKHLLILLSGPEPQRTMLENLLLEQLQHIREAVVFVRGLPNAADQLRGAPNIQFYNHLPSNELNQVMNDARIIISRSGYSTIMDLAVIKKKSILIPTPGQTEQEYLASRLMKQNFALSIPQSRFKLTAALHLAQSFPYEFNTITPNLTNPIKEIVQRL